MKFSDYTSSGAAFTPLNSPGGSTLQLGAGRGLLRLAPRFKNLADSHCPAQCWKHTYCAVRFIYFWM